MLISGNPSVTKEHLDNLEAHFKQRYGEKIADRTQIATAFDEKGR